jgi:3-hydroxyisobutyrate dehydrogenase-like beta-hydroxyacid dehydrogenase
MLVLHNLRKGGWGMVEKRSIGFIGVGAMGSVIAKKVVNSDYPLMIYDKIPERMMELIHLGAGAANSISELAESSHIIMSCLPNPEDVRQVYLEEEGVLRSAEKGAVIIEFSTIGPHTIKELADKAAKSGIGVLDSPVSRSSKAAEKDALTLMVGGKKEVFEEYKDILQLIGHEVHHVGDIGAGNIIKLINNVMSMGNVLIAAEAFILGVKAGADPDTLYNVISTSGGNSNHFSRRFPNILKGKFEPGFAISLAEKDLRLALEMAYQNGYTSIMAAMIHQMYLYAVSRGKGDLDFAAIIQLFEDQSSVKARSGG